MLRPLAKEIYRPAEAHEKWRKRFSNNREKQRVPGQRGEILFRRIDDAKNKKRN